MSDRAVVGVYWGRFNPPHQGHLEVIRRLRKSCQLIVAIGSSEERNTPRNPFGGRERKIMMEAYLREAGIRGVKVLTLRDGPSEAWAIRNLLRRCRPDVLFLSTEKRRLARRAERKVRVVRFRRTGTISSSRIRRLIASGNPSWRVLTGRSVARLIERWDGWARIAAAHRPRRPRDPRGRFRSTRTVPGGAAPA